MAPIYNPSYLGGGDWEQFEASLGKELVSASPRPNLNH
jgi:hypothetical protein